MENICRLCLDEETKLINLFTETATNEKINKIYELSGVLVTDQTGYPNGICFNCNRLLEISWKFRKQIQESHNFITENFKNIYNLANDEEAVIEGHLEPEPENDDEEAVLPIDVKEEETFELLTDEMCCEYEEIEEIVNVADREQVCAAEEEAYNSTNSGVDHTDAVCGDEECDDEVPSDEMLSDKELECTDRINTHFTCGICARTFKHISWLQKHEQMHVRRVKCTECDKVFKNSRNLVIHQRTHTGERPYKCNICGKQFTQAGNLHVHQKCHSGERNHKCVVCDKRFKILSHLNEHIKTHTNERQFKCDKCQYETHKQSSLKTHIRTHTGERPYECEYCSKTFNNISNFKAHVRIHTGEKKYSCRYCAKSFVQHSLMTRHEKLHTKRLSTPANT